MYRPKDKEFETDALYDAARSFAMAADALQTTAESLRTVAQQDSTEPAHVAEMVQYLQALFERFQETEDAFFKALNVEAPARTDTSAKAVSP